MEKFLIIRMSSLGDVILSTPVPQAIKEEIPDAFVCWLVEERNASILKDNPYIDGLIVSTKSIKGILKAIIELRKRKWDICLDLQSLFKSALFSIFSGARKKLGLEKVERGAHIFYDYCVPNVSFFHAVENNLLATYVAIDSLKRKPINIEQNIRKVKKDGRNIRPRIYLTDEEKRRAEKMLNIKKPIVVLCPGTTWGSKRWLPQRWAKVGDALKEEGFEVVIIGGKEDIPHTGDIISYMKHNPIDLTGKTNLREASAVLEKSLLAISVDSGAMHMASAVDTPVIALFGPTDPKIQGPYGEKNEVIYKKLPCSPCRRRNCPHKECMELITEEEVIERARLKLSR
jgi:lipopolysaccharide heptosyltransferase II